MNSRIDVSFGFEKHYIRGQAKMEIFPSRSGKPSLAATAKKNLKCYSANSSLYKTLDNITAYIYILLDNVSRFILNWKVFPYLSDKESLSMVKEAFRKYLTPFCHDSEETMLVVDGGPENNNSNIDAFVNQELIPIRKLIAQKDIKFSNSMVEAFNKTLKYRHLFPHSITDYKSLVKHLKKCIPEYNMVRPHCAHKYLTPAQVYFNKEIDLKKIRNQLEEARKRRIIENRKVKCAVCDR
jgi:putative transposase